MRRAKLPPRKLSKVPSTSPPQDGETDKGSDPMRHAVLPPIRDGILVAPTPPQGKPTRPQFPHRTRPKTGMRPNNGQCQASPSMTAAHTPAPPPPREGPYFSYKDVVHKMSNTQLNLNLPDIRDQQGQAARSHLRVMPTSKQLTVINEIANTPARLPRESTAHIGQKRHAKSPQDANADDLTHSGEGAATKTGNSRLPPLEKLLKRRGTVRKNNIYES